MADPKSADRPDVPEGYGTPTDNEGLIEWTTIDARLRNEMHFWLSTVRPDGRPHVVPRWGAWLDGKLYYDGAPTTVHARNAELNPNCTMSVGNGAEAIILEGQSVKSKPMDVAAAAPLRAEITRKYGEHGYTPEEGSWSDESAGGLRIFTPTKALAWFNFPTDMSRFRF
jgi:hypothetical protein